MPLKNKECRGDLFLLLHDRAVCEALRIIRPFRDNRFGGLLSSAHPEVAVSVLGPSSSVPDHLLGDGLFRDFVSQIDGRGRDLIEALSVVATGKPGVFGG